MAAPSFVSAGTGVVWTTGAAANVSISATAGNIVVLQVLTDAATTGLALSTFTNIVDLNGVASGMTDMLGNRITSLDEAASFGVGAADAAFQHLVFGRAVATSTCTVAVSSGGGEDLYARFYQFTNVNTGSTISAIAENGGATHANGKGTSTSVLDTGVTTNGVDRLACNFVAIDDDGTGLAAFVGETGGDWGLATPIFESSTGTDGTIALMTTIPWRNAWILQEDTAGANTNLGGFAATTLVGQSFSPTVTTTYDSVEIFLHTFTGAPTDGLTLEIRTDSGGSPSSTVLASQTLLTGSLTADAWNVFNFTGVSLTASTTYWVVVGRTGAIDGVNFRSWRRGTTNTFTGAPFLFDGATWAADGSTNDRTLRVKAANIATTINGGSDTITSDNWGVVGFALIGTTVVDTFVPRNPTIDHMNPGLLMKAHDAWERRRGILVPRLWTPEGATI